MISLEPACSWTCRRLDRDKMRIILLKSSHDSWRRLSIKVWVCNLLWGSLIFVFSLSTDAEKPYRNNLLKFPIKNWKVNVLGCDSASWKGHLQEFQFHWHVWAGLHSVLKPDFVSSCPVKLTLKIHMFTLICLQKCVWMIPSVNFTSCSDTTELCRTWLACSFTSNFSDKNWW